MTDLRKAAQDALDTWDYRKKLGMEDVAEEMEALRAALQPDPMQRLTDVQQEMEAIEAAKQRLLEIMRRNSLATGHGDTIDDALKELDWQLSELDWQLSELRGKNDGTL